MTVQRTTAGIDIGADALYVCVPTDAPARRWPVTTIDLKAPAWAESLRNLVPPGSLVALEPTGWHYSRPVVVTLERHACVIVYVNHASTAATRADHISAQKTDVADARALAVKAHDVTMNNDLLGCKMHDPTREALTIHLRLLITKYTRAMTQRRSALNHIGAFGHGIWPALDYHKETYARAVAHGVTTPAELRAWNAELERMPADQLPELYRHWRSRCVLAQLVAQIADAPEPDAGIIEAIHDAQANLAAADEAIARVEARASELVATHPLLGGLTALWQTVPLASLMRCAMVHAAANCHAEAFTADELRAACGCHPSRNESGRVTEAHESKRGYRPAKAALHLWTIALLNPKLPNNPVRDYYQALAERGNKNALHAARGKLVKLLAGIARSGKPYDPHYNERTRPHAQE